MCCQRLARTAAARAAAALYTGGGSRHAGSLTRQHWRRARGEGAPPPRRWRCGAAHLARRRLAGLPRRRPRALLL
eukprot:scaffold139456_cov133-Phaeocystis_antarctica.AAC.1